MKIKSFYITENNIEDYIKQNFLGDSCLVYSLNIQAFPGTKFQIGNDNEDNYVLIGGSGNLKLECENYPIDYIKIGPGYYEQGIVTNPPNINIYPIIIDIAYKGEITNE